MSGCSSRTLVGCLVCTARERFLLPEHLLFFVVPPSLYIHTRCLVFVLPELGNSANDIRCPAVPQCSGQL